MKEVSFRIFFFFFFVTYSRVLKSKNAVKGYGETCPSAFKSARTGLSHSFIRMTYPSGLERPIPTLLEALE